MPNAHSLEGSRITCTEGQVALDCMWQVDGSVPIGEVRRFDDVAGRSGWGKAMRHDRICGHQGWAPVTLFVGAAMPSMPTRTFEFDGETHVEPELNFGVDTSLIEYAVRSLPLPPPR